MKTEEITRFFEDMGYFPYAFGFIGCILNATLGSLGNTIYFPKPTLQSFTRNLLITWFFIFIVYAGFPIIKEYFPAIDTTPVQIAVCIGIGAGGIPSFKFLWLMFCALFKTKTGIDPNDCIKKDGKPANEQTS